MTDFILFLWIRTQILTYFALLTTPIDLVLPNSTLGAEYRFLANSEDLWRDGIANRYYVRSDFRKNVRGRGHQKIFISC